MKEPIVIPGVALAALLCGACGVESEPNPFSITGNVQLIDLPDGGSSMKVRATVVRPLADGGSEPVLDAGVAFDGVPLGAGAIAPDGLPDELVWTRDSFDRGLFGKQQTLSVIGASPAAEAKFNCPPAVTITAPQEGAVLDRTQPVELRWTPAGGSPGLMQTLAYMSDLKPGEAPQTLLIGFALLQPDVTSAAIPIPQNASPDMRLTFTLLVEGEAVTPHSSCVVAPMRSVILP